MYRHQWQNVQHYNEGVQAFQMGLSILENPFLHNIYTQEAMLHWYEGWTDESYEHINALQTSEQDWEEF